MATKESKAKIIDELEEGISGCNIGIMTDYRGLSNHELTELRRKLGDAGIKYRVVKNTMARFAAERLGRTELAEAFNGPVALALGYGEAVAPAKVLLDYIKASKSILTIKGGFLDDQMLTAEDITALSKLPSREILIAKLMGNLQSPIASLVNCLNAPISGLARVLQARVNQLEGE